MSVAFRRESDEEHKEPRFEIPLPSGPNLVTRRGFDLTVERVAAFEALVAGADTDLAREAARRDLRYWRTRQSTAEIAPQPEGETVAFGSRVTITLDGRARTIDIVGDDEAEPARDRLAFTAPLARVLIGAEPGEWLEFGGRADAIEVIATGPIPD